MRTIWKGAISFGLVHIPVKLYLATKRNDIRFTQLHEKCGTPIKYKKFCVNCDTEIPNDDIVKGYEYEKGKYVLVSDKELEGIPLEANRAINILDFVDLSEVDPVYFDKTYYLAPNDGGQKPYELLRQAMQKTGRVAVAKVVIRSKETLAAIRVFNNIISMETMFHNDEIRSVSAIDDINYEVNLHENELKMAESLISSLSSNFEPSKYKNEYQEALMNVIQQKITGEQIQIPEIPKEDKVVDLMEALKASIELAKEEKKVTPGKKPALEKRKTS